MSNPMTPGPAGSSWTFLTNHGHVLICIAADPQTRMRDVAQRIVAELEADGYVRVTRVGRRNRYEVNAELPLRHPIQDHRTIGHLVELGLGGKPKKK